MKFWHFTRESRRPLRYPTKPCHYRYVPTRGKHNTAGEIDSGPPRPNAASRNSSLHPMLYNGELVISGISGRFPKSQNMEEFKHNLLQGIEMTTTEIRTQSELVPLRHGLLKDIESFDANYFGIPPRQAACIDPQIRLLIEVAFEAIVDAGINPAEFRGSRTGVFCGAAGGEAVDYNLFHHSDNDGMNALAVANFSLPGRVSFALDLKGPSFLLSAACASSIMAVEVAVNNICLGKCDAAVVTGSNILLNPMTFFDLFTIEGLSPDGRCKVFDDAANGFTRSEAAVAIVIQKKDVARRRYVTIRNVLSSSDGFKYEGIHSPSGKSQEALLRQIYAQAQIDPGKVSYVEVHGTGTPLGDVHELPRIHKIFCEEPETREKPLLVGAVKSNMGHTESAAGLCGLAKTIIAIQTGIIPASINFNKPREELKQYFDDSLKYVTKHTPFDNGLVGISSFGIVGTNSHIIVEPGRVRSSQESSISSALPVLIPFSGRSEAQVEESLRAALSKAADPEFAFLTRKVYQRNIPGFSWRGYGLLKPGESDPQIKLRNIPVEQQRPVWAIFPGMGSQWNEMGRELKQIEPFAESYKNSLITLKNLGIDLDVILEPKNQDIFHDIRLAGVAIVAIQIALYDTLKAAGIQFEGFIGHSMGEFLCAYADGCLSAEETLLVTEARGRAFNETKMMEGGMASIGMSWEEVEGRLPPDIQLACNNSLNNVTISGPAQAVSEFVDKLKTEGKFAVMVNSCGIAAHSRLVSEAADLLSPLLWGIIKGERVRSPRWISTTIPEKDWESPEARLASFEYFELNVRRPVLFYEALSHIPPDAVLLEISPKGFFQAIVKESVPASCEYISPMVLKSEDRLCHFFQSVGEICLAGVDVDVDKLYPPASQPVSADVPSLSPLVQWNHENKFKPFVLDFPLVSGRSLLVDTGRTTFQYLCGHKIEDLILYPATGYLQLIWDHFSELVAGKKWWNTAVVFSTVQFHRATILKEPEPTTLVSRVLPAWNKFEIINGGDLVVSGSVSSYQGEAPVLPDQLEISTLPSSHLPLHTDDIYKEFRLRGYNYSGLFQGIRRIDNEGRWAEVYWTGNWTSFLDTLLQTSILRTTCRHLALPTDIDQIIIDPREFLRHLEEPLAGEQYPIVRVAILHEQNKVVCPGIELKGLNVSTVPSKRQKGNLAFEKYTFCPFVERLDEDVEPHLGEIVDLILENTLTDDLKVYDIFTAKDHSVSDNYFRILSLKPLRKSRVTLLTLPSVAEEMERSENPMISFVTHERADMLVPSENSDLIFVDNQDLLPLLAETLKPGGFLVTHSMASVPEGGPSFTLVSSKSLSNQCLGLFRKLKSTEGPVTHVPLDDDLEWIEVAKEAMAKAQEEEDSRIYLTSQGSVTTGILGLVKCLRQEDLGDKIRCILDPDTKLNLNFAQPDPLLQSIMDKDLVINVFQNNSLGSYRHIPLGSRDTSAPAAVVAETSHAYVRPLVPGDLSSLRWIQSPLSEPGFRTAQQSAGVNICEVAYAGINFRDVLLSTCTIPLEPPFTYKEPYLGFEFSGYDGAGNRVMGLRQGKVLATSVEADPRFTWNVPDQWTLEEAATVPVVYTTALYAFHSRAKLGRGQSVLIHAGTGGVGQAAISVALAHECTVYTTAGTPEKRAFLKRLYPEIPEEHIMNSRDTSFEHKLLSLTHGKGVDVVLNSLAGDKLLASVRCLATNGKFLEIGVYDAFRNTPLGLRPFLKNIEFHGVELYHVMTDERGKELTKLMTEGIQSGAVRPLPTHVFQRDQLEEAFRFMANGKHAGKVLIHVRNEHKSEEVQVAHFPALASTYFHPEKTYVIVGGLGGLGLEVANWLVERGARRLTLTSRSGLTNGYQSLCLRKWLSAGVKVEVPVVDLSDRSEAENFFRSSKNLRIGGIFNSALVLQDNSFPHQNTESFRSVAAPKAGATEILDDLSRRYCPELDYFVVFSSAACGRGNAEQSNYGWANAIMERICERRVADGLHGLAIQWGVIGQVGLVAEKLLKSMDGTEVLLGMRPQNVDSCVEVLDAALQQTNPIVSSMVVAEKQRNIGGQASLLARIAKIFGIENVDKLSPEKKLTELGMDSLVGVELKQMLERDYDMAVTKQVLLSLTVGDLVAIESGTFTGKEGGEKDVLKQGQVTPFRLHEEILVRLNGNGGNSSGTMFIVHGLEGSTDTLETLASTLPITSYGFQYGSQSKQVTITALADAYIQEMKTIQPTGPFTIAGYSGGAAIAFEMAIQLEDKHNEKVSTLVFLDGYPSFESSTFDSMTWFMNVAESKNLFHQLGEDAKQEFQGKLTGDAQHDVTLFLRLIAELKTIDYEKDALIQYFDLLRALFEHRPTRTYSGKTVAILAKESNLYQDTILGSQKLVDEYCVGQLSKFEVAGDHESFLSPEFVAETVDLLQRFLIQPPTAES